MEAKKNAAKRPAGKCEPHPILTILPPLTPEELAVAAERVRLYGQQTPIEVLDGKVVVGWEEHQASIDAGIEPSLTRIDAPPCLVEYVLRRNVPRHLSTLDRAVIAVLAQDQYKALGRQRMSAAARAARSGTKIPSLFDGERWWQAAARIVGTKPGAVRSLASIRTKAPDVFEMVRARQITVIREAKDLAFTLADPADRAEALARFSKAKAIKGAGKLKPLSNFAFDVHRERTTGRLDGAARGSRYVVHEGDMAVIGAEIPAGSVDAIYADILYKDVGCARAVGKLASRVLVEGGVLALIDGNGESLPILNAIAEQGLRWIATGAVRLPRGTLPVTDRVQHINSMPVFFLSKGAKLGRHIQSLSFESEPHQTDFKAWHTWQKDVESTKQILRSIVRPGGRVLDPCCGSGTTGVAAIDLGYEVILIDRDPNACRSARHRCEEGEKEHAARHLTRILGEIHRPVAPKGEE